MEESLRQQLISALERLGRRYPSMRFGQLVCFAAFLARGPIPAAAWEAGDEEMLKSVLDHLAGHPNP